MGGIEGRLFREFAVTLSVAITISLAVSLTTTPMMCAYLLAPRREDRHGRLYRAGEQAFAAILDVYDRSLRRALQWPGLVMLSLLAALCFAVHLFITLPQGYIPEQDNGLIWGGIAFVILFFLLAKFAYPTIKKGMDERAEKIRTSIDEADQAKTDAQRILDEYQRQLADARSESARIIEEARQAADRLRQDLKRQAETEVTELRARAQEDIQAQVQRAMADLQARVGELAIELAEKVVERSLDRETNMQLIENYINQVGSTR